MTDDVAARTFRKWRKRLDALKASQAELRADPAHDPAKLNQTIGAITVLSGVLDDLQAVRPVNTSVLNV